MSDDRPVQKIGFASFFASTPSFDQNYVLPPKSPAHESTRPNVSFKSALSTNALDSLPSTKSHEPRSSATNHTNGRRSPKRAPKSTEQSKRNYKCLADPDLDKTLPKGSRPVLRYDAIADSSIHVQDPRLNRDYAIKSSRGKRKYRYDVVLPRWTRDANSFGPEPPHAILITELSTLTTSHEIGMQFRGFGEFAELKLQVDPANGSSLGLCRIVYRKNTKAGNAANAALLKMNGAKVGGALIKVTLDGDGTLCEQKVKQAVMEREESRALAAFAAKKTAQVASPRESPRPPAQAPSGPRKSMARLEDRNRSERPVSRDEKPFARSTTVRKDESRVSMSTSETNKRLGSSAYIFISGKVLPLTKVTPKELQLHFSGKKNEDIFTDSYGFYITFVDDVTAAHAHRTMDRSTFLGFRLPMELHKAKKILNQDKPMANAFKKSFQPADPVMETTNRLIKELQEVFMRDLRSRIAGPAILDFLNPAQFSTGEKSLSSERIPKVNKTEERRVADVLSHIPRFKKNKLPRDTIHSRVSHRMDHHAMYDSSDASDTETRDQLSDRPSSVVPSIDEGDATPLRRKVAQIRKTVHLVKHEKSDSEGEDFLTTFKKHDHDANNSDVDMVDIVPHSQSKIKKHDVDFSSSEDEEEIKAQAEDIDMDSSEEDAESIVSLEQIEPAIKKTTEEEEDLIFNIVGIQTVVKDQEDYDLLQEVLQDVEAAQIKDLEAWATALKGPPGTASSIKKGTRRKKETSYNRINPSGAAKTEGHYQIPDVEKSYYLPNRNRAAVAVEEVGNSSSRMNRANNRRQAAGFEAQRQTLEAQTDLLRFNSLKSRKKQLKFSRSAIHDWGLYALEHIERGDMVIEYVGEIIRQQVADHREKRYERQGIGSSYLFRIDEDTVIDATKSGNIARFINHSCDPSCTAKIIQIYNQKKIVIYALKDIAVGEEVTYDYKFEKESEDKKIPCLCGSAICRRTLN